MRYVWVVTDHQLCGVYSSPEAAEEKFRGYAGHFFKRISEELIEVYFTATPHPRYTITRHEVQN